MRGKLFKRNDRVAVASSGGKDSTVLGYVLKLLNERYDYGLELVLLSIDEGITGYRDDSLESVKRNQKDYGLPLTILSYKDIYGWTMDDIVKQIGLKSNCTFCGVFRRQALDRGAMELNCDSIVTGHNADDLAETILMNVLRGDIARLKRSCFISTGFERTTKNEASSKDASISADSDANKERSTDRVSSRVSNEFEANNQDNLADNVQDNLNANQIERPVECCSGRLVSDRRTEEGTVADECCSQGQGCLSNTIFKSPIGLLPRSKPFKYTYEKEIVMYAHFKVSLDEDFSLRINKAYHFLRHTSVDKRPNHRTVSSRLIQTLFLPRRSWIIFLPNASTRRTRTEAMHVHSSKSSK